MKKQGFTLLELMVSISILLIILLVGIPSISSQVLNTRLNTSTDALYEAFSFARTEAVAHNQRVTIKNRNDWGAGWDIFIDANNNGNLDEGDTLLRSQDSLASIKTHANSTVSKYLSFIGSGESRSASGQNGGSFQAGTIKVCTSNNKGYKLVIARGGRVRTSELTPADCSF